MDDLISRQAAIEAIDAEIIVTGRVNAESVRGYVNLIADRIKRLPSAQPERWIPVSERSPNGQTEVIVSCVDDSGDTKFRYTSSGWVTTDGEYWIVDNEINPFVVAWMPMPDPYKGEE